MANLDTLPPVMFAAVLRFADDKPMLTEIVNCEDRDRAFDEATYYESNYPGCDVALLRIDADGTWANITADYRETIDRRLQERGLAAE